MATALMVSIKSVFYLAAVVPVLLSPLLTAPRWTAVISRALLYGCTLTAAAALLYVLDSISISDPSVSEAASNAMSSGNKTLFTGPLVPRIKYIFLAFSGNPLVWSIIILGLLKVALDLAKGTNREASLCLLGFAVPLLSLLIYRNAFPYFFVFLMPLAVIPGGMFVQVMIHRTQKRRGIIYSAILCGIIAMMAVSFLSDYHRKLSDQTVAQSE